MPHPLTIKQIATEVRAYLRASSGCRVKISWLHQRIGCAMADLITALETIKGITRDRGCGASVMFG